VAESAEAVARITCVLALTDPRRGIDPGRLRERAARRV